MASLRRKDRSPYWFACYTDADGSRAQRSTKQSDRKRAQAVADQFEKAAKMASERRLGDTQARLILSELLEATNNQPLPSATAEEFLSAWPERRKNEITPSSCRAYAHVARTFLSSLGSRANLDISQITKQDVLKCRDEVAARTSTASANKTLKYIRVMLNGAWKDDLLTGNPAEKVDVLPRRREDRSQRRGFTEKELKAVLAHADSEWYALTLFGLYTGQRLGDLASLRWEHVNLDNRVINFTTSKTGREMDIPIAAPLWEFIIKKMRGPRAPTTPLFPSSYPIAIKNTPDSRLSQRFQAILARAGLAEARTKDSTGKGRDTTRSVSPLSFHSLRHTATSMLKNAGVAEPVAMDIIGHNTKAMSRHYTHIDIEAKREALGKLPDITQP